MGHHRPLTESELSNCPSLRFVMRDTQGEYRWETEESLANGVLLSREDFLALLARAASPAAESLNEVEELQSIAGDAIGVCATLVVDADSRPRVYSVIDSSLIHRARDCVRRAMGDSAGDWPHAKEPA